MFLERVVAYKREVLEESRTRLPIKELKKKVSDLPTPRDFIKAITPLPHPSPTLEEGVSFYPSPPWGEGEGEGQIRIIAEIKKASPSRGVIREDFDPIAIARIYEEDGAAALSILTEEQFFQGHLDHIKAVNDVVSIPILRKDFIFDEYQVYEARCAGADAILLIAEIITDKDLLKGLLGLSHDLGMTCLMEVHDERGLEEALDTGDKVIGINNRDLKTFKVDLGTTHRLIKYIPKDRIVVSESGISTYQDISCLQGAGVKAFLIGETLMREKDIGKKLRELRGIG